MLRFWNKVDKTPGHGPHGDCWIWTAYKDKDGYGRFRLEDKKIMAHRFGYELQIGEIPEGLLVLHTCDYPPCVRGDHLFTGTELDNAQDRETKGRGHSQKRRRTKPNQSWCSDCKTFQPLEYFSRNKHRWNGIAAICKICAKIRYQKARMKV